jgi:NAD(P)-dependent dehydrogenase (short-subunit alcohol dehydrogenase family)
MQAVEKVAVITGSGRGIGLATAHWFLEHDYRVALLEIDAASLARAAHELTSAHAGHRVLPLACDVSKPASVDEAVAAIVARWQRIDALVNNAGVAVFKPLLQTRFEEWRYVMATNLDGVFLCSQACASVMLRNGGGSIVNIASISGLRGSTLRVAYGTSKAAVIHLTRQQAAEWGAQGLRVNAVAPGPVETAMAREVHSAAIRRDYHDAIPLGRYGTEREMAEAIGFLCSDAASYINGHTLAVDGGFDATGVGLSTLRTESESTQL